MDHNIDVTSSWAKSAVDWVSEDMAREADMPFAALKEFARAYFRRVDERYKRRLSVPQVILRLVSLATFAAQRRADETKVRVFAPAEKGLDPSDDVVVLETCMSDQRFIVDTLRLCASELGLKEVASVNIIVNVRRDAEGKVLSVSKTEAPDHVIESVTHFVLLGAKNPEVCDKLFAEVTTRLSSAALAVGDYQRVRRMLKDFANSYEYLAQVAGFKLASPDDLREATQLLQWLVEDHFLFMAGVSMRSGQGGPLQVEPTESLGTWFRFASEGDPHLAAANRMFTAEGTAMPVIRAHKSAHDSRMHRSGKIDVFYLRRFDDTGAPDGGVLIYGLFTRRAFVTLFNTVPYLRRRLQRMLEVDEIRPASHLYKGTINAFNALPINYLFEAGETDLHVLVKKCLDAESSGETATHIDLDPERHTAYAFVILDKESFTETILEGARDLLLQELKAQDCQYQVNMGLGDMASMHFYVTGCQVADESYEKPLHERIMVLCTPWRERLRQALRGKFDEDTAKRLHSTYMDAFPEKYHVAMEPEHAVADVEHLDALTTTGQIQFDILPGERDQARDEVRLRLYRTSNLYLSDILPILDHFGFRVLDQDPIQVKLPDRTALQIDTFRLRVDRTAGEADYVENKERLVNGLRAVFEKRMVSDPLNRLMVRPGLTWEDVDVLRAYLGYSMQLGPFFAADVVHRVLYAHPILTGALADYYQARFNPHFGAADDSTRGIRREAARRAVTESLTRITDATEDRVFRIFLNLIDATVRTNLFRTDRRGHYISFKFDCSLLEKCPEPRPLYEIYVHHAEMEGVHLRGGRVARGGLRWSDRLEDYRTEIFGLMRTQMVKNVLIVPVGAKGGFVVKGKPKAGQDRKAYGDAMYEILIRGLLDLTDNRVEAQEVRPKNVIAYDEFDPYLVVAADKGTAHLSDTANRISAEYGHWLGDAFASGGSDGYDHKVEGITARGAWACVRHHFLSIGVDPDKDVIRVVGIGDMAGDVFGNGMLRSRTIKLVGAFNHMHVFLDPDPDTEKSYLERERMFRLPRSSWADYRKEAISKGGGVWLRTEKSIALPPALRELLGTDRTECSGEEVIRMLLIADVDLLYNGGIGTYIKATDEDNREVGDKANDAVRVSARDVRARVIGEGGNLGMTQKARIEYCLKGGRCNTDAIDNSGGVDLSDHEVNLKILFTPEVAAGRMSLPARNKLLRDICPVVDEMVVADNDAHALMLTLDEIRSRRDPYSFVRAVEFLSERRIMHPKIEGLPKISDLQARTLAKGFMRPELSKITAFSKMFVFNDLVKIDAERIPRREHLLQHYFPEIVLEKFRAGIDRHMLRREILATVWNNHMHTYVGGTFFPEMLRDTERGVADVALAYSAVDGWLDAFSLRKRLLALGGVSVTAQYEGLVTLEEGLREASAWLLHFLPGDQLHQKIGDGQNLFDQGEPYREAWSAVVATLPNSAPYAQKRVEKDMSALLGVSLPQEIAREIALSCQWAKVFPVHELARKCGSSVADVAHTYLACGQQTGLNGVIFRIGRQPSTDPWEAQALRSLRQALLRTLYSLAERCLEQGLESTMKREPAFQAVGEDIARLQATDAPMPISVLVVLAERLHKALVRL